MDQHIKILGALYLVVGVLGVLGGLGVLVLFAVTGSIAAIEDPGGGFVVGTIGLIIAVIIAILAVPNIIAGLGLIKYKEWARVLTIILNVLMILQFPIGTALGIYGFWVLFNNEAKMLFEQRSRRP